MESLRNQDGIVQSVKVYNIGYYIAGFACAMMLIMATGCDPLDAATVKPIDSQTKSTPNEVVLPSTAIPFAPELQTTTPTTDPSPTPEPTKSFKLMAEEAGLDAKERSYIVETRTDNTYLVDTYNKVPKAVMQEDGTWRKLDYHNNTDAETMYSWMTPLDPEGTTRNSYRDQGMMIPDEYSPFYRLVFSPVYTGDWVRREVVGPEGQQLTLTYLITTWRNDDGGLRVMEVGVMADSPVENFDLTWACRNNKDHWYGDVFTTSSDFLNYLRPGLRLAWIDFPVVKPGKMPKVPARKVLEVMPWVDWEITNSLPRLVPWLMAQSTEGQLTWEEANLLIKKGKAPDQVLVSHNFGFAVSSNYKNGGGCP